MRFFKEVMEFRRVDVWCSNVTKETRVANEGELDINCEEQGT
jgi:hypothetical protein